MPRLFVADVRAQHGQWAITPEAEARLNAAVPAGWTLHMVKAPTVSDGDGGTPPSGESLEAIAEAEAYFGFGISKPLFAAAKKLKWVHSAAAWVGSMLYPEMLASDVILTNSAGIHAIPIAEHAVAGVLSLVRGLDIAMELQRERAWKRDAFLSGTSVVREIGGLRALIIGAGGLGRALGTRLSALGVHCTGVRRRVEQGVPAGFERIVGPTEWKALLPETDILAICAPATAETKALVGSAELDRLPKNAIVVNVARGVLLDEAALVARVKSGALRGAVLDVFAKEPLPADSPLWDLRSVILTPHVSGVTNRFWDREAELVVGNWTAYDRGERMRNVVDKKAGY
jgi:phosphoglycerate dehydrogenase-like enzyme